MSLSLVVTGWFASQRWGSTPYDRELSSNVAAWGGNLEKNGAGTWDAEEDEWIPDAPVVLFFGSVRFEFCANKLSELFLSRDSLDVAAPLDWGEIPLVWRRCTRSEVAAVMGQQLIAIDVCEYLLVPSAIQPSNDPPTTHSCLVGLDFTFENGFLSLANGLDQNSIASSPCSQNMRRLRVRSGTFER